MTVSLILRVIGYHNPCKFWIILSWGCVLLYFVAYVYKDLNQMEFIFLSVVFDSEVLLLNAFVIPFGLTNTPLTFQARVN